MIDYSRLDNTIYASDRVRCLKALVVGAGALGNEVIKALALLGTRELVVVDPDAIEPSNLTRSILLRTPDCISRNKAEAIAGTAQAIFPDTRFKALPVEVAEVGLQELARVDLLFSCVDSDLARLEIAYLCTKLNVPCCDGGLGARNYSHGRVTWFPGGSGACFSCMLPAQRRRQLLTTWDPITTPCTPMRDSEEIPSTPMMAAIIGSLQVDFALRKYLGSIANCQTMEVDLNGVPRLECFSVGQSSLCPFHWDTMEEEQVHTAPALKTRIGEWLSELSGSRYRRPFMHLDWPICTKARCLRCQFSWTPLIRAALIRRSVCPSCESHEILALECVRNIDQDSEWAVCSFSDLHLPADHLITARFISDCG